MKGMHPYDFGNGVFGGGAANTNARQVLVVVKYNSAGVAQWERNLEVERLSLSKAESTASVS